VQVEVNINSLSVKFIPPIAAAIIAATFAAIFAPAALGAVLLGPKGTPATPTLPLFTIIPTPLEFPVEFDDSLPKLLQG